MSASPATDAERAAWQEANRGFLARNYPPTSVREQLERPRQLDRRTWRLACEMGWTAIFADARDGGLAGDSELVVGLAEELGRAVNPSPFLGCALSAAVISADPSLDRATLAGLLDGSLCGAWCALDGDGPWSAEAIRAEAVEAQSGVGGDGALRLTTGKSYVLDADLADVLLVSARVDGVLSNFLIPASAPGVTITTARGMDLTRRISRVELDGVVLRAGAGSDPADGEAAVRRGLRLGAVLCCADATGVAERLMEMTVAYVSDREVFGRPLATYQAVKHSCADMLCTVEAARVATRNAALHLQLSGPVAGHPPDDEAQAERATSIAKGWVGEACARLAGEALQLHGGIGFTWEHDLHLYLRRARADEALFGSSAWHRDRVGAEIMQSAAAGGAL
jgi:alkylation response protein AidB-like acyl-CoA dehydrogenase